MKKEEEEFQKSPSLPVNLKQFPLYRLRRNNCFSLLRSTNVSRRRRAEHKMFALLRDSRRDEQVLEFKAGDIYNWHDLNDEKIS